MHDAAAQLAWHNQFWINFVVSYYGVGFVVINTDFFTFTASVNAMWFKNRSQKSNVYLINMPDFEIQISEDELRSYFLFRYTTATN